MASPPLTTKIEVLGLEIAFTDNAANPAKPFINVSAKVVAAVGPRGMPFMANMTNVDNEEITAAAKTLIEKVREHVYTAAATDVKR